MIGTESVLDLDIIESIRLLGPADGPSLLDQLIKAFIDDASDRLNRLQCATASGDCAAVCSAAHSLKSMCAAIGARQMAALADTLELRATEGSVDADLAARIRGEFESVAHALRSLS